ncbi:MAG: hypothetical protein IJJ26_11200 [Victivallales bacterium]|nr:hypothetical protein [Victivallales bacterium]
MLDFLWETRAFLLWCVSLLLLTGVLWAVPRTRRMRGIFMTGWKSIPVGFVMIPLVPFLGLLLMQLVITGFSLERYDSSLGRFLVWGSFPFFWFPLGIVCAVWIVSRLCRVLKEKYQAEIDALGLIGVGMLVALYTWMFLIVRNLVMGYEGG